ncbi:hypothetical protein KSP39_PZI014578 [Platanthera zijinensis]|uniref:Uncharacterized protein n=1 Tax=Platanthera zijinensis TaxID=2320716 RepID=A0AAP0B9U4_9ASPA
MKKRMRKSQAWKPHVLVLELSRSGPETGHVEPRPASVPLISRCRLTTMIITVILLVRNFTAVVSGDADGYAFSLATVLILRAMGILLPFYCVMRLFAVIHNVQKLQLHVNEVAQIHEDENDLEQQ